MAERGENWSRNRGFEEFFGYLSKGKALSNLITPRADFNKEKWLALQKSPDFLADLQSIRQEQKIPKGLDVGSDMQCDWISYGEDEEMDMCELSWVGCLSQKRRTAFESAIKSLLHSYKLPMNFYDFILGWLLYRKMPKGIPLLNLELPYQILDNPTEALRISLSKAEKRLVLNTFRKDTSIGRGRVPSKNATAYKQLQNLLARSKNTFRRRRSLDKVTEILKAREVTFDYTTEKGTRIKRKKTLREVVEEFVPLDDGTLSFKAEHKAYVKIRQQKSRLLKRLEKSGRKVAS